MVKLWKRLNRIYKNHKNLLIIQQLRYKNKIFSHKVTKYHRMIEKCFLNNNDTLFTS